MAQQHDPTPPSRPRWTVLAFVVGFAGLIVAISLYFLLPALDAAKDADPAGKRQLAAYSRLLLAVLLFILLAGLMLTFRFGRFFLQRSDPPRKPTQYTDAWAESARRMQTPPPDEGEQEQ